MKYSNKLKRVLQDCSVELENRGATARDHLANERTFLAWLRTALAFASIGIAVAQFFRLQTSTSVQNLILASVNDVENPGSNSPVTSDQFYRYLEKILARDHKLSKFSIFIGGWFIATGTMVAIFGLGRYFISLHHLQHGKFPVGRYSVSITFLVAFAVSFKTQKLHLMRIVLTWVILRSPYDYSLLLLVFG